MAGYKFEDAPNTACFTCKHVLSEGAGVLFVSHDSDDGGWQFLCGAESHTEDDMRIAGLGEIIESHPGLNDLFEMPRGVCGERNDTSSDWKFFRNA